MNDLVSIIMLSRNKEQYLEASVRSIMAQTYQNWELFFVDDASKGRPSDDQVMMLIKEKTGVTNSSVFQQLPADIKKSILKELKGKRASLRQLERLTGISKSMIYRMG